MRMHENSVASKVLIYDLTIPYVTESFWIGTMNYCAPPVHLDPAELVRVFGGLEKIKFKDSVRLAAPMLPKVPKVKQP